MAIYHIKDKLYIFILPNIVNRRMNHIQTIDTLKILSNIIGDGSYPRIYVEKVAYQPALVEQLRLQNYDAKAVEIHGDKRTRLSTIAPMISSGHVLFPKEGAEELANQLINFGSERYDDLADALSLGVNQATTDYSNVVMMCFI